MIISKKKTAYPINYNLSQYLKRYNRKSELSISYEDMLRWQNSAPVYNKNGENTLWESVTYDASMQTEILNGLKKTYADIKTEGDTDIIKHLTIGSIDYCLFGNSNPFRIKIVNSLNDHHDYFYIKVADASRIYGLELEHILSPNRIEYIVDDNTLIESHIVGIPGDKFMLHYLDSPNFYPTGMAKEFVKFNERCFVLLLGDMRSYNYVIEVTPDFDREQYRVRAIDFDQTAYEGRKNHYLPQFYKENNKVIEFCIQLLTPETVEQYRYEERALMKRRYNLASTRLNRLFDTMKHQILSTPEKISSLARDLDKYHQTNKFHRYKFMGRILKEHILLMINKPRPQKLPGKVEYKEIHERDTKQFKL